MNPNPSEVKIKVKPVKSKLSATVNAFESTIDSKKRDYLATTPKRLVNLQNILWHQEIENNMK